LKQKCQFKECKFQEINQSSSKNS